MSPEPTTTPARACQVAAAAINEFINNKGFMTGMGPTGEDLAPVVVPAVREALAEETATALQRNEPANVARLAKITEELKASGKFMDMSDDRAFLLRRAQGLSSTADELRWGLHDREKGTRYVTDLIQNAKASLARQAASYPPESEGRYALRQALFSYLVGVQDKQFQMRAFRGDAGGWAYVDELIDRAQAQEES